MTPKRWQVWRVRNYYRFRLGRAIWTLGKWLMHGKEKPWT
jgi:hypothetical protein